MPDNAGDSATECQKGTWHIKMIIDPDGNVYCKHCDSCTGAQSIRLIRSTRTIMTQEPPDDSAPFHCPKCNSPIPRDSKFCEICGERIEQSAGCSKCGAPLQADAKFCEICGTPVSPTQIVLKSKTLPVSREPVAEELPEERDIQEPDVVVRKRTVPRPEPIPDILAPDAVPEPSPPMRTEVPDSGAPARQPPAPLYPGTKAPASKNMMIIAGIVVVAILAIAIFAVVLPGMSGSSGTKSAGNSNPVVPVTTITASPTTPRVTTSVTTVQATSTSQSSVSLVPGPTQTLPANQELIFQVDKDSVSAAVTVTVTGPSRNVVNDIAVRLTRSDGQVLTGYIKPNQKVNEVTLPGTRSADRVEVTVNFYSGDSYKVIDKIVDFARRM